MKNLRKKFNLFCFRHRNKGIPNLMLFICIGTALVYLLGLSPNTAGIYSLLYFDRSAILQGQLWRLISYPLTFSAGSTVMTFISLLCYYSIGQAMENIWGTLRFNIFYFTGIVLMDIYCMIFGGDADVFYLNMGLFLSYATLFPDAHFLLFFIIPVKAWIFAVIDLFFVVLGLLVYPFPYNLFPVVALLNYFLFFGKDVVNVFPVSWRANFRRLFRKKQKTAQHKPIVLPTAGSYEASQASVKAPYTHRCTVCGRTDVSDPDLEFRYCSRCNGYYCYCQEHISNHTHIE